MVTFFDRLFNSIINKNKLLDRLRYYSILRLLVRLCANIFIPIYYILTKDNKLYSLNESLKSEGRIIVSLTSFPSRIDRIWIVLESLLRQKSKPDLIILWLSLEQFSTIQKLPGSLTRLQKRGVTIKLCGDDLRSHKKYYYAMKEYPRDYIITVDDDVIYNSGVLTYLVEMNKKFPLAICCNQALKISIIDGEIGSYLSWKIVRDEQEPTFDIMPIGLGGILYPPVSLYHDVFNEEIFKNYCFLADDIWLNVMARMNGTLVAKTGYYSNYLPIINSNNIDLSSKNRSEGFNDKQLKSLREYYKIKLGIDPFANILTKLNTILSTSKDN